MRRRLIAVAILVSLCMTTVAGGGQSPTVFKKVDFFIHAGDEVDDRDAQLILDPQRRVLIIADEDHASQVFATVYWDRITGEAFGWEDAGGKFDAIMRDDPACRADRIFFICRPDGLPVATASAWPGTLTLRQTCTIMPSPSIRNVARSMPMNLRPCIDFSTHTP